MSRYKDGRRKYDEIADGRYMEILDDLINLAINRFSWEGLPVGLTSEILELMLIRKGTLMFYKKSQGGYYILPCSGTDQFNPYGMPTKYEVYSANGKFQDTVDIEEGVLLRNNPLGSGNMTTLEVFAKRINDIEMTQEVNLFQQNIPKIILSDDETILTAKAIVQKIKQYSFVIFGKKSINKGLSKSEVLDNTAPYILDKLQDFGNDLMSQILSYLGIKNNDNSKKKERQTTTEIESNDEFTSIMIDLMYDMRVKFCDDVKEMFDYDISVKKREVEEDVAIYNDTTGSALPTT